MPKVDADKFNFTYLTETEDIIRRNTNLFNQLNTGKKAKDFKEQDYVKCTYIKGLLQVVGTTIDSKIIVQPLLQQKEFDLEAISPEFLVQTKIDDKVMDLLYGKHN